MSLSSILGWSDLDPHRRPALDSSRAHACVASVLRELPARGHAPDALVRRLSVAVHDALLADLGPWTAGATWTQIDGGPVRTHPLAVMRTRGPDESAAAVVRALGEWQQFLLELADLYTALRRDDAARPLEDQVERAAARLLPLVVHHTDVEDAWYGCFTATLHWYLESCGHTAPSTLAAIEDVVSGHFSSWVEPTPAQAAAACTALGLALGDAAAHPGIDGTTAWTHIRDLAFLHPPAPRERLPVRHDGHRRYIDAVDRPRDPARAERMHAALDRCRADARRPLTFERLAAWQALVLGEPRVDLRTADAFAKHGREHYPCFTDLRDRLDHALAGTHTDVPLGVRAARVYLDVCFLHPFADGNARAARLALDHVLTREGLALHRAEPIFTLSRAADDARGAWNLAHLIEQLVGRAP